jgi:hypothetical protein
MRRKIDLGVLRFAPKVAKHKRHEGKANGP